MNFFQNPDYTNIFADSLDVDHLIMMISALLGPDAIFEAGIAYAVNQIIDLVSHGVQGIHLYTMNRSEIARRIYENVKKVLDLKAA